MIQQLEQFIMPTPGGEFRGYGYLFGFFILVLAAALYLRRYGQASLMKHYSVQYLTVLATAGLVVYLFRYENVLYFSSTASIWILYGGALLGILWLITMRLSKVPEATLALKRQHVKQKYLPKNR